MKAKVSKYYKWEMGHRLPFHEGPCRHLHGHSYKMRITLEGDLDKNGMLLDYYEIDKIVTPMTEELDHCFLLDLEDKLMIDFCGVNNFKHKIIDKNTTAENIAEFFIEEFSEKFGNFDNIDKLIIEVCETEDACAERFKLL